LGTFAVIDVGSNSVKLYVAAHDPHTGWRDLIDRHEITRLTEKMYQAGEIRPAALERTVGVISTFVTEARLAGAERIAVVGTMGLRVARNAAEFVARVAADCGVAIEIIPGEEEARLSFLAVQVGLGPLPGEVAVFDIGGGSTEITFGRDSEIYNCLSLPVGAVHLTEQYLRSDPVTPDELAQMLVVVRKALGDLGMDHEVGTLVGVGGTITNLSAVRYGFNQRDPGIIQGTFLARADVDRLVDLFREQTVAQRRLIVGLEPERADVILAGAGVTQVIMGKLAVRQLIVSARGLRHGLMVERFGG